jgi:hypothetical protein
MRRSASEIINNLESRITQLEKTASKFPPKAVDLNKVTDSEGFWNMSLGDLKALNPVLSTRGLKKPNAKMSDIIFFLNMASGAWENTQKGRKASGRIASDFDPRKAMMSFDIIQGEDEVGGSESDAVHEIKSLLKVRSVDNEGHGSGGELICKISVSDLTEVARIIELVQRNTGGGEDTIYLDDGFQAQGFTLYPQGFNGDSYQMGGNGRHEDLEEYLEDEGVL